MFLDLVEVGVNVTVKVAEPAGGIGLAGVKAPGTNMAASPPEVVIAPTVRLDVPVL